MSAARTSSSFPASEMKRHPREIAYNVANVNGSLPIAINMAGVAANQSSGDKVNIIFAGWLEKITLADGGDFQFESGYFAARGQSILTLSGFVDGIQVEQESFNIGNDVNKIEVDWDQIDQLTISSNSSVMAVDDLAFLI